uniref:Tetratricopeptide repeat protein 30 n=1 Tax=Aceria tosichella TaxID=561515 RepID=A0A6G1SME7_9ACAR
MDDLHTMEEDATELFRQGKFSEACAIFKRLSQTTDSSSHEELYKFNIASCHAAQEDYITALNQWMDLRSLASDDIECMFNKAVCMIKLNRPALALSIMNILARNVRNNNKTKDDHHQQEQLIVQLLVHCMNNLDQHNLNRSQCRLLEKLLNDYKPQIVAMYGEDMWTQNMGHVLFIADNRFSNCLKMYETLVTAADNQDEPNDPGDILKVDPMVLSNLCVSYILTGRNRDAEELIKEIEYAEETQGQSSFMFDKSGLLHSQMLHNNSHDSNAAAVTSDSQLTHMNLAIGTLYCVKGNHEFGLSRIFKSLEPIERKLTGQFWRQAKKCILSTLDKHCKQLIYIKDELFEQMIAFLIQCETHGVHIIANNNDHRARKPLTIDGRNSVTYEARYLRSIILTLIND